MAQAYEIKRQLMHLDELGIAEPKEVAIQCIFIEKAYRVVSKVVAGDMDDFYDESESNDGMWDDEGRLEELELRFYEGIDDAGMYWPPSP